MVVRFGPYTNISTHLLDVVIVFPCMLLPKQRHHTIVFDALSFNNMTADPVYTTFTQTQPPWQLGYFNLILCFTDPAGHFFPETEKKKLGIFN